MFSRYRNLLRLRYSVRVLLIAVTLLCVVFAWFGVRTRQAKKQADAVRTLEAGYVVVGYDYNVDAEDEYTGSDEEPDSILRRYLGTDFFSEVVRIEYRAGQLPNFGLAPLANIRGPRHLSLRGASVRDEDIFVDGLQNLETLDAAYTDITDSAISRLTSLNHLQELDLSGTAITDVSVQHYRNFARLRRLILRDTFVSEDAVESLRTGNPSITVVWSSVPSEEHYTAARVLVRLGAAIWYTEETEATAEVDFFRAPGYSVVIIGSDDIWNNWKGTEKDISHLRYIEGLSTLYLSDLPLTESLWQLLSELPTLKSLTLSDMKASGLGELSRLEQLVHLSLQGTSIRDRDVEDIAGLPLLESLSLQHTGITDNALLALEPLQHLRRIDVSWTQITDAGIASFLRLDNLEELILTRTKISDTGLAELQHHKSFRHLALSMTLITDNGLTHLAALAELERLDLSFTSVSDAGLAKLRGLSQLKTLHLSGTNITDKGLEYLTELSALRDLWLVIDGTKVTEAGVSRLQRALPQLQVTRIGDAFQ